jgi:exopolyphosphatase/guanosine-5'-triphosphate,3'-diphosphate pyrophosphatase
LESVQQLVARLSALTTEERAALPCVQAGRAQVIVGGAVIVWAAMEMLGYDRLTVSERDLLDGLAQCGV